MPSLVFAADLGGTKLACAAVDHAGKIVERRSELVDASSARAPIAQIARLAGELDRATRVKGFRAAGVAVPGLVRRSGTVWAPNLPGWDRVPLAGRLRQRLRIPVAVESDRNCAVLGEMWRGAAKGKQDAIALVVGTGIGAGIVAGGQIVRGAHELSGCAGWMVVGEETSDDCARTGYLEAFTAGPAIARAAQRSVLAAGGSEVTALTVAEAARRGDPTARQIFERAGTLLGLGVANLISLFDPEVIVLGGGMAGAADLFFDAMRSTAQKHAQPLAAKEVEIKLSELGGNANLLGAAKLAWALL
jgi:glucokinase